MNLTKLFEAQRVLDERIEQGHPREHDESRTHLKALALLVEIGEAANEWRGFKFWSKNQNPVTTSIRPTFGTNEDGSPHQSYRICNPLLEELVDCLHFVLSIGNEEEFAEDISKHWFNNIVIGKFLQKEDTETAFRKFFAKASDMGYQDRFIDYLDLLWAFYHVANSLGFTSAQIETAYFEKNEINHQRQQEGY